VSRRTLETRELAACLRHDLRDPLGAITHWLHLLDRAPLDAAMRERAIAGIRSAMDEQLRQIERLGQVLEWAQVLPAPLPSQAHGEAVRLSVRALLEQVLVALGAGQRDRIEVGEVLEIGDWEIVAQTEALVDALTSLLMHGLRQLLVGERLRILGRLDAPAHRVALCLQARPVAVGAIEQPWRMLAESQPSPSLAILHARCVLSRHQAGFRITTFDTDGDTLEIDFPVSPQSGRTST
jgi:signal transduction histidine kinase